MSRILIIDDDDSVREELKERIESMGHESEEAACQDNALAKLDEMVFDCVLLDLGIPVKYEGVARVDHGKNLLQRIVARVDAPPVIIITANSGPGHKLAVEMMKVGAKTFVSKPFDENPIEPEITWVLSTHRKKDNPGEPVKKTFSGGTLVLNSDGIEVSGVSVGGIKGNANIRRVVELLSQKNEKGIYRKLSAKTLAECISPQIAPATITSSIKDFRETCCNKLECGTNDVIKTNPGGGYQLAEWIEFRLGTEDSPLSQAEKDKAAVLQQIKKKAGRNRRQICDNTGIPATRVKSALSALVEGNVISLIGSGSAATYSIKE